MTKTIEAIYERGVLRLKEPIQLAEGAEVEVIVVMPNPIPNETKASPSELLAAIAALPEEGNGVNFSGREHDRILYGENAP
jgi:predicted DNA-binding antitoxin AbrB/MazE fold protein